MTNTRLMNRWFDEVWNLGLVDVIDELLAENCEVHGLDAAPIHSREQMKAFHATMNQALSEIHITLDRYLEVGHEIGGMFTVNAVHNVTKKPVTHLSAFFVTVVDGQIKTAWNVTDFLTMFVHAGVLPPDTMVQGLASDRIR